jgi:predicted nuclease of predicted toxin-antitoxin system
MCWLVDECVASQLVARLRASGHDVWYVAEFAAGMSDFEVIQRAHDDCRLLLTADKDFGELVFRRGKTAPGLVLLRIDPAKSSLEWYRLVAAIDRFGEGL